MMIDHVNLLKESLDKDLFDSQLDIKVVLLLQIVRLLREKPLPIIETLIVGWSPDGNVWYPSEPGTYTTGG